MPFQKGQSGNPGGKPEQKPFTDALRLAINRASGDRKRLDNVASMLVAKAEQGDVQAILAIADRLDGKPVQQNENYNWNEHVFADLGPEMTDKQFSDMVDEIKRLDTSPVYRGNGKHHGNGSANGRGRTK